MRYSALRSAGAGEHDADHRFMTHQSDSATVEPGAANPFGWLRAAGSQGRLSAVGVWFALLLLGLGAVATAPEFFGLANLQDVLRRSSILGIVTMGQVLVLLTAGLDLSVAAVIGLTAVAIAESGRSGGPGVTV